MTIAWKPVHAPGVHSPAGVLIGLAAALYVLGNGRVAGIAGIVCRPAFGPSRRERASRPSGPG